MDLGLRGRVALVSGAGRGIGRAVAEALAAEGVSVVIAALHEDNLERVAANINEKHGVDAVPVAADLSRAEEVQRWVDAALARFGRADILVNVAGNTPAGRLLELTDAQWAQAFELKFMAAVRASRAVLPSMLQQKRGCIVNIAGTAGWQPLPHQLTLGAVNAALINFTRGLSREAAAAGVRVNAVVPGVTETDRLWRLVDYLARERGITREEAKAQAVAGVPDGRAGTAPEVAAAVLFLVSEQAAHVNGVALEVDGGETRGLH